MPRTRRAAARKPLTLGFAGLGALDTKAIAPLLDDLIEGAEVTAVYIPVTDELFTDAIADVVEWCRDKDIPYTTLSDENAADKDDLKDVIDDAADDYDAGDDAVKGILELLAGDENEPVADGRLIMFFDGDQDDDVAVIEEAEALEVPAFDMLDGLSPISFGDEDDDAPASGGEGPDDDTSDEAETPEPVPATSRRRKAAAASAEDRETVVEGGAFGSEPAPTRAELLALSLVELKKRAKAEKGATTESLRGLQKADVVDLLLGAQEPSQEADSDGDEAQQSPRGRGRRSAAPATASEAVAPVEGDSEQPDAAEAVFERLRGQRETAERIGAGVSAVLRQKLELDEEAQQRVDVAAGALGAALMVFAEVVIVEARKPKSPGRPRKDGTEAQPREAEEAPKTRRRRQ